MHTLSTALKFALKFFRKRSFFDQNQQPFNNVEPFERIFRELFITQCLYKFSTIDEVHALWMAYKQAQKNKQKEIKKLIMDEVKFAFALGINGDVKRQKF